MEKLIVNHQVRKLQSISYLAPNWFDFYQVVITYLAHVLCIEIQLRQGECDPLEDPLLLNDQLDIAFICGLPLMRYCRTVPQFEILVAPVMRSLRYQQRPIYFSDVIVNAASQVKTFEDLQGKTLCYNDPGSNSGYNLLWYKLLQSGYSQEFFSKVIQSGSHQRSIRWVVDGLADCAAIDSIVLEQELHSRPELSQHLRVVDVLGPSPIPPVAVATHLDSCLIEKLRLALLYPDEELQAAMVQVGVECFVTVEWQDYLRLTSIYDAVRTGYLN
jgi:phosphonate transport system substrate-binding protein